MPPFHGAARAVPAAASIRVTCASASGVAKTSEPASSVHGAATVFAPERTSRPAPRLHSGVCAAPGAGASDAATVAARPSGTSTTSPPASTKASVRFAGTRVPLFSASSTPPLKWTTFVADPAVTAPVRRRPPFRRSVPRPTVWSVTGESCTSSAM